MSATLQSATHSGSTKKSALIERLNVWTAFAFGILGAVITYVIANKLLGEDTDEMMIHNRHDALIL